MRHILSQPSRSILTRLARERTLCAFDFDGTLAPIAEHPDKAELRAETRLLLGRLAAVYPCVVLSGRSRSDLLGKLTGVDVERAIGNHGAELDRTEERTRRHVRRWKAALEPELGAIQGLWVEDKGISLSVHYRQCPRKAAARRRIVQAIQKLNRVRVVGGKQVVNLLVEGSPGKGAALAAERDRLRCEWALYVGDDENDEDAFALNGALVSVRVGVKRQSNAGYYLRTQSEIDRLLDLLVSLRTR